MELRGSCAAAAVETTARQSFRAATVKDDGGPSLASRTEERENCRLVPGVGPGKDREGRHRCWARRGQAAEA